MVTSWSNMMVFKKLDIRALLNLSDIYEDEDINE